MASLVVGADPLYLPGQDLDRHHVFVVGFSALRSGMRDRMDMDKAYSRKRVT